MGLIVDLALNIKPTNVITLQEMIMPLPLVFGM